MHARHASRQLPEAPSFAFPRITEIGASQKASPRAPAHARVHDNQSLTVYINDSDCELDTAAAFDACYFK